MGTDIHGVFQKRTPEGWKDIPSEYTQDRHYMLFAWLGNVRNGTGFAGVPTHDPIKPLSDGRGYPDDFEVDDDDYHPNTEMGNIDPRRRKWVDLDDEDGHGLNIWMGDHSHSWVTGDEVLAGELPTITRTGIIERAQYEAWDKVSQPGSWAGGVSGPGVKIGDMDSLTDDDTYVRVRWQRAIGEELDYFIDEVKRLKEQHGEVRFVFGFDS